MYKFSQSEKDELLRVARKCKQTMIDLGDYSYSANILAFSTKINSSSLPSWLFSLVVKIHGNLPPAEMLNFPVHFIEAIPVDVDLSSLIMAFKPSNAVMDFMGIRDELFKRLKVLGTNDSEISKCDSVIIDDLQTDKHYEIVCRTLTLEQWQGFCLGSQISMIVSQDTVSADKYRELYDKCKSLCIDYEGT